MPWQALDEKSNTQSLTPRTSEASSGTLTDTQMLLAAIIASHDQHLDTWTSWHPTVFYNFCFQHAFLCMASIMSIFVQVCPAAGSQAHGRSTLQELGTSPTTSIFGTLIKPINSLAQGEWPANASGPRRPIASDCFFWYGLPVGRGLVRPWSSTSHKAISDPSTNMTIPPPGVRVVSTITAKISWFW